MDGQLVADAIQAIVERIYDRFGRGAAWIVAIALLLACMAVLAAVVPSG